MEIMVPIKVQYLKNSPNVLIIGKIKLVNIFCNPKSFVY